MGPPFYEGVGDIPVELTFEGPFDKAVVPDLTLEEGGGGRCVLVCGCVPGCGCVPVCVWLCECVAESACVYVCTTSTLHKHQCI